jgi:uncharacterized protein (UPF0332 family)
MKEYDLNKLLSDKELLNIKIRGFLDKSIIKKQSVDMQEVSGHIEKSEHNLNFIKDNLKLGYTDWCITGCYYAAYHAVLALISTKGYGSKNHLATLCVLIKEFYKKGIEKEDLELIDSFFVEYQDLIFYVESKQKREDATYSSKRYYDKKEVEKLRIKTILFINKIKDIIKKYSK